MVFYNLLEHLLFEILIMNSTRQHITIYDEIPMWGQGQAGYLKDWFQNQIDPFFSQVSWGGGFHSGNNSVVTSSVKHLNKKLKCLKKKILW